jgi:hypothetical protein
MEAFYYLCAAGLGPEAVSAVFVDPDRSNFSWTRTGEVANWYHTLQQTRVGDGDLFRTRVTLLRHGTEQIWTPFRGVAQPDQTLDYLFAEALMSQEENALFLSLYSPRQRDAPLKIGFQGNPSIGAAVLADRFDIGEPPWRTVVDLMSGSIANGQPVHFFEIGSIFGGTGTSGLRAIPRLIHATLMDRLGGDQDEAKRNAARKTIEAHVSWGAALLLPYFRFERPKDQAERGIGPDPNSFGLRAKQALEYYAEQAREPEFNRSYAIGVENPYTQPNFSLGSDTQKNRPHVAEFLAGLAAADFFANCTPQARQCAMLARQKAEEFAWSDVPAIRQPLHADREVQPRLAQLARMCFVYLKLFYPALVEIKDDKRVGRRTPWYVDLLETRGLDLGRKETWDVLDAMRGFSTSYLRWLVELHDSNASPKARLANTEAMPNPEYPNGSPDGKIRSFDEDGFATLLLESKKRRRTISNVWRLMCDHSAGKPGASSAGHFLKALFNACR